MQNKINWAHAHKKGLVERIAQLVQAHDAATPSQQIHLRIELATFIQNNYLHMNGAPCVFCNGNRDYVNEARAELQQKVEEELPTEEEQIEAIPSPVDDAPKKTKKSKSKIITETE